MKQGDVICENGMRLLVVSSYDHKEPCMGCFSYKGAISCIFGSLLKDDCNIKDEIIDISKHIKEKLISDNHG